MSCVEIPNRCVKCGEEILVRLGGLNPIIVETKCAGCGVRQSLILRAKYSA